MKTSLPAPGGDLRVKLPSDTQAEAGMTRTAGPSLPKSDEAFKVTSSTEAPNTVCSAAWLFEAVPATPASSGTLAEASDST